MEEQTDGDDTNRNNTNGNNNNQSEMLNTLTQLLTNMAAGNTNPGQDNQAGTGNTGTQPSVPRELINIHYQITHNRIPEAHQQLRALPRTLLLYDGHGYHDLIKTYVEQEDPASMSSDELQATYAELGTGIQPSRTSSKQTLVEMIDAYLRSNLLIFLTQKAQTNNVNNTRRSTSTMDNLRKHKKIPELKINKRHEYSKWLTYVVQLKAAANMIGVSYLLTKEREDEDAFQKRIPEEDDQTLWTLMVLGADGIPAEELRTLALNKHENKGRYAYLRLTEIFKGSVNYHDIIDIKNRIHQLRIKGTEDATPIFATFDKLRADLREYGQTDFETSKEILQHTYEGMIRDNSAYALIEHLYASNNLLTKGQPNPDLYRQLIIQINQAIRKNSDNKTPILFNKQTKTMRNNKQSTAKQTKPKRGTGTPTHVCNLCEHIVTDRTPEHTSATCRTRPENYRSAIIQRDPDWIKRQEQKYGTQKNLPVLPVSTVMDIDVNCENFILDIGSHTNFARGNFVPGTFVLSPREFNGFGNGTYTSRGFGEIIVWTRDTNKQPRKIHVLAYEGPLNIFGNTIEQESDINNIDYEIKQKHKIIACRDEVTQDEYDIPLSYNGHYYIEPFVSDATYLIKNTDPELTHRRLCHKHTPNVTHCTTCIRTKYNTGKSKDKNFNAWRDAIPGIRWCADITYLPPDSPAKYVLRFHDPASTYSIDYLLLDRNGNNITKQITSFIRQLRSTSINIRYIHADNEFNTNEIRQACQALDVSISFSAPYAHTQNSFVERSFRTTKDRVRACMVDMDIHMDNYPHIWQAVTYVTNRLPTASRKDPRSPHEILYGSRPPDLSRLRVLGSTAYVNIAPGQRTNKHQLVRRHTGILIGFEDHNYLVRLQNGRIQRTRHVDFDERSKQTSSLLDVPPPPAIDNDDDITEDEHMCRNRLSI